MPGRTVRGQKTDTDGRRWQKTYVSAQTSPAEKQRRFPHRFDIARPRRRRHPFRFAGKKIKHRFNAAATTLPNRTGPYRTAVGNDVRTGRRCFENVPTAAALLSKFTGTREFAARAILSARQRKRNRHQPTAAVIVPQTADMSAAVDINAGRGFLFRSGIFRVMGRTAHDD